MSEKNHAKPDWHNELNYVFENWKQENHGNYVVISPDVDGLTSAAILNSLYPIKIIGIYTTTHLMLLDEHTREDARKAIWLDHDINQEGIRCVGQHLVLHKNSDKLPLRDKRSWNPNIWKQQSWSDSFKGISGRNRDKYPYGTSHFIWDLANRNTIPKIEELAVLAHADGTWFALDCYKTNGKIWKETMFNDSAWVDKLLNYRNELEIQKIHRQFSDDLYGLGFSSLSRSIRAKTLPDDLKTLVGRQSLTIRISNNPGKYLQKITEGLDLIGKLMQSRPQIGSIPREIISGTREVSYPNRIQDFDKFMIDERIFSHAFTDLRSVSYTINMQI